MSFLKTKKFWIPTLLISTSIITIGTGLGVSSQSKNSFDIYPSDSKEVIISKLKNALETINDSNIQVNLATGIVPIRNSLSQTGNKQTIDAYAFDINNTQLSLNSQTKLPNGINIELKINETLNSSIELNKGNLKIDVIAKSAYSEVNETKVINLNNFKKIDANLASLIKEVDNKAILEIPRKSNQTTQQQTQNISYQTIEELNNKTDSITGLSALVSSNLVTSDELKTTLEIKDEVKLDSISKQGINTYFNLVNTKNNGTIKLINNKNGIEYIALVDEIKVLDLAASEIKIAPNGYSNIESIEFANKLKTNSNNASSLTIKIPETNTDTAKQTDVLIHPYIIQTNANNEALSVGLEISFGSGENKKTYNTFKANDLAELKNAGFSFSLFTKKLSQSEDTVKLSDINTDKKLDKLFVSNNFKMSFSTTNDSNNLKTELDKFSKVEIKNNKLNEPIRISIKDSTSSRSAKNSVTNPTKENWIAFAAYTYKDISLYNLLLTPNISLIHLEKIAQAKEQ